MKRLAVLLLCFALLLGAAATGRPARALAAGAVTFADPNLEAAVREAIGKPEGDLTPDDVATITSLWAYNRNISNLAGIAQLVNLRDLQLSYNQVSDLTPLRGMESLRYLTLGANPVTNLAPLTGLTLTRLDLNSTPVSDLRPLANMTSLAQLSLGFTKVRDLTPLAGLTNLDGLWLHFTPVSDIKVLHNLTALQTVDLARTNVADLTPLTGLPRLQWLYIYGTAVRDLRPLATISSLTLLYASDLAIADLTPLASLTSLQALGLGSNRIADLTPLSGLQDLYQLYLDDNQITSLDPLSGMIHLQELSISNNQITSLAPLAAMTDLRTLYASGNRIADTTPLGQMGNLTYLDLQRNQVSDLTGLAGMTALVSADLSDNQITDIDPVAGLTNLERFEAPHNQITAMGALAGKPMLTVVHLEHNRVESVPPLPGTANLEYLSLSYNQVASVTGLADLPALSRLFLDWNQVTDIAPLAGHTDLRYLQLFGNQVTDISPLADSTELYFLQAGRNQIRDISVLAGLPSLQSLGLFGNQITDISALANLPALTWLHLGDNQISDITPLSGCDGCARIDTLDLSGNRISEAGALATLRPVKELNLSRNHLTDISPLAESAWVQSDSSIDLQENFIDLANPLSNRVTIDALRSRGARVYVLAQRKAATGVVAVVIDNSPQAGPPAGIAQAPVVYEVAVAPGITRLLALFDLTAPVAKIGPVRSSRDALVQLAAGHQGAFAHAGGSYSALKLAPKMPVTNLDEIYGSGDAFYRDDAREAPHNLFTNTALLQDAVGRSDRPALRPATWFPVGSMTGGTPAAEATAHFTAAKQPVRFQWDGSTYVRQVGNTTATDADGNPIAVQNVVTLYASHQMIHRTDVGELEVQAALVGSGTAQFYRDGLTWTGRWSRATASAPLTLTVGGKPYQFADGNSWLMVADAKAGQDGYITGTVTVTGQTDAAGVLIEALDADGAQVAGMLTGADGTFRLRVPAGTYTVRATLAEFAAAPRTGVRVLPGKTATASFTLAPAFGDIKGSITDKVTGQAPGRVVVHLLDRQKQQVDSQTTTNGSFSFEHVAAGSYTVTVTDEYHKDASVAVPVTGGRTQVIKATVVPVVGTVGGKVVDTGNPAQPVADAEVALVNTKGETVNTTATDSNGEFHFDQPVPEGTYRLTAIRENYKTATLASVKVTGGKATNVTLTMQYSFGTVSVRVSENRKGNPAIAGATVTILTPNAAVVAQGETDAQGHFDAIDLPEGSYTVRVTQQGFRRPKDLAVKVTGGKTTVAAFKLTPAP